MGLQSSVIDGLLADGGHAISYHCIQCRSNSTDGPSDLADNVSSVGKTAFNQLLVAVGALCAQVRALSVSSGACQCKKELGPGPRIHERAATQAGEAVRDQVREVYEQDKRKLNVILRGFGDNMENAKDLFKNVVRRLINKECDLIEMCKVSGQTSLFRAKISDMDLRSEILSSAKRLKDMEGYHRLFIQRDLTYQQRQELFKRRDLLRAQVGAVTSVAPSVPARNAESARGVTTTRDHFSGRGGHSAMSTRGQSRGAAPGSRHSSGGARGRSTTRISGFDAATGTSLARAGLTVSPLHPSKTRAARGNFRRK